MADQVLMPTFGLTEGTATINRWFKRVGDAVQRDETLLEAETEKATVEVPSPASGVLLQILAAEGQAVPLTAVIAWVGREGEAPPAAGAGGQGLTRSLKAVQNKAAADEARPRSSPVARNLAREHGIDLSTVQGSGPGGRIVLADIQRMVALHRPPAPEARPDHDAGETSGMSRLRSITAQRLSGWAREVVPVPLFAVVDMSEATRLRTATRDEFTGAVGTACSYNALIVQACGLVLREYPALNAHWTDTGPQHMSDISIGLAVAVDDGLLVPVIRTVDALSLRKLQSTINRLIQRARSRQLEPDESLGGTFTVTSLGSQGVDAFAPAINPPQAAILGVGRIAERPVVISGQLSIRSTATFCLVFDHRALDGFVAAQALARLKQLLENPYLLL